MDGDGEREAAQLEREIEETREHLDQTFDELEERLSVEHLVADIRGRLDALAHSALDAVEQRPTLVIAGVVGAALLLRRRQRRHAFGAIELTAADLLRLLERRLDSATNSVDRAARDGSQNLGDYVSELIAGAGQRLDRTARQTSQAVSAYAGDAIERAGRTLSDSAHLVQDRGEELLRHFRPEERHVPLSYGLLGLALVAGIALARSRVPRFRALGSIAHYCL